MTSTQGTLAAYGAPFDLAPYPLSGPPVTVATIDTGADGLDHAPGDSTPWTVIVSVDAWPDSVDVNRQIVGPDIILQVEAGQAALPAPKQMIAVPGGGIAIPACGPIVRASVIALPFSVVQQFGRFKGTIQIRRGQPQRFVSTALVVVQPGSAGQVQIPPFSTLITIAPNTTSSGLSFDFNPINGGKVYTMQSAAPILSAGNALPIPKGANSVTIVNGSVSQKTVAFAFEGFI